MIISAVHQIMLHISLKNLEAVQAGRPGFDPGYRRGGDFSSLVRVQTGPEVHSASYKMSTGGFPQG